MTPLANLRRAVIEGWPWLLFLACAAAILMTRSGGGWWITFPTAWHVPAADWINTGMDALVAGTQGFFRAISGGLGWLLSIAQWVLTGLPWLGSVALICLIAWQGGGTRLALICLIGLLYILSTGYWTEAMNTLALVLVALPLSVMLGFAAGYAAFQSERAQRIILVLLDLMQTVPAFAYLIPILLLFGFGPVVGLIASVIFAMPPMVRNTLLGFQQIQPSVLESATMSGCTPWQRFKWAEVPSAWPQMLIGVNQTTMAALSMVIIAAIIGGFEDIGWEVLSSMRKAQFGQSLFSGLVIVVLAILLDRITAAYAKRQLPTASFSGLPPLRFALSLLVALVVTIALGWIVPGVWSWPETWILAPANRINSGMQDFMIAYGGAMAQLKNTILFYLLLPVKLGFERAIAPFTWGFAMTPAMKTGYWVVTLLLALGLTGTGRWREGVALTLLAGFMFYGATGLPWVVFAGFVILSAWSAGGRNVALFAALTCAFLLLGGLWAPAMLSVYLCFVAVTVCIVLGGLIGIWAAGSNTASAIIRPVNDMLQTLPQFVLLIPALMLFQVGDFTALLAIVAYAIVPMIRYTEHGLRSVPQTLVDAGVACGCSRTQLFWQVKLPQAFPQLLIGLNQTILYGLGMLVIAALVGTTGLGQAIYVALGKANAGAGLMAGIGMALIAMCVDRILQSLIRARMPG